ncbi:hypothetical protein BSIN_4807 [Burkholderia singularis]|uniref:Uncharacterized protein n=1 Tax=Burkholderia singularis TaxID=1503053 RepID=A0A238H9K2_9BURK|nr:hypothetical protein BSIN_4807 [Burkholderia singularis]
MFLNGHARVTPFDATRILPYSSNFVIFHQTIFDDQISA